MLTTKKISNHFLVTIAVPAIFVMLAFTAFTRTETVQLNKGSGNARWKMGVALYSFNHHSFAKGLGMAASCNVKYVEGFSFHNMGPEFSNKTMGSLDENGISLMKKMLKDRGLTMTSMYVDGARNAGEWKRYFDMGKDLGLKYLVCEPAKEHWDIVDSLAGIYHIKIAIHEHKKGSSIYWHPDSVLAAIKGHKNIGACADLGHWVRSGLDPVKCLKALDGHIIGVHLKDIDKSNHEDDVNVGTGSIDFVAVVKELERQKFSGFIDMECEHNMEDNQEIVKESISYFNNVK